MLLVSKTYSQVTPESSEDGDFSDTGFIFEDEEHSFRELVDLMREHGEPSCYPASGETYEWLSSGWDTTDYSTGEQEQTSIHYSRNNPPRNARYWRLAMRAAGIIKSVSLAY